MTKAPFEAQLSGFPFYGREVEIDDIIQMIEEPSCQILTLVGSGGIGKTRLAQEVARRTTDRFYDGHLWVNLQPLAATDFVVPTLAELFGVNVSASGNLLQEIIDFLHNKNMLLILDNFETVIDFAATLSQILMHCPDVNVLVTSREALQLRQEWIYSVGGLAYPADTSTEDPFVFSAVALFVETAQRIKPEFNPTGDLKAIIRICQHVEGMPLALEIAASWIRSLSVSDIAAEIGLGLGLLTTRMRDLPQRHRSIQVVFEQTCRMLTASELKVFQRLSIFRGTISRSAAREVAEAEIGILANLIDKSLLQREDDEHYRMHELVRQYAASLLELNEDDYRTTQRRHYTYFLQFLQTHQKDIFEGDQKGALVSIAAAFQNIHFAWLSAAYFSDVGRILECSSTLSQFYRLQGRYQELGTIFKETLHRLEQTFEQTPELDTARLISLVYIAISMTVVGKLNEAAESLLAADNITAALEYKGVNITLPPYNIDIELAKCNYSASVQRYQDALSHARRALEIANAQNDAFLQNWAYYALAQFEMYAGNQDEAKHYARRCIELAIERGDQIFTAMSYVSMGRVMTALNELELAIHYYQTGYQLNTEFEHQDGRGLALTFLADAFYQQGRYEEALAHYQQIMDIYQDLRRPQGLASVLDGAAYAAMMLEDRVRAAGYAQEGLKICADYPDLSRILSFFGIVCALYFANGETVQALPLTGIILQHDDTPPKVRTFVRDCLKAHDIKESSAIDAAYTETLKALTSRILAAFPQPRVDKKARYIPQFQQELVEALSEREQEVLHYISEGMKNREIADTLYISLGTVKSHINNIYGKLQVRNRVEALIRAKEYGFLR